MRIKKHKEKSRLIVSQGDELLVLQKIGEELEYGFIGGFLEVGESPETALVRETYEETEPHKFAKVEWVYWKDALKFLGKSDKKVIKELFKPCKLTT